jgi:uncharacterized membrane protein YgcG
MKTNPESRVSSLKFAVCAVMLLLAAAVIQAESSYPQPENKYVNDFAGILSNPDRETIADMMRNLEKQAGVEMTVVTINTIADYPTGDADVASFAGSLFRIWDIGKKSSGILMLVSKDDRQMRIQLGEAYGFVYEVVMQRVTESKMIPFFKGGYYSRGIYEGVREVISKVLRKISFFEFYMKEIIIGLIVILCVTAVFMMRFFKNKVKPDAGNGIIFGGGASGSW